MRWLAAALLLLAGEARGEDLEDKSLEELMEIDVETATRAPQSAREVPSIVTVITREDIATWGFQSVGEALVLVPGVYCIDDHVSTDCGVRGITAGARGGSRIVKVMIDGQPVAFRSDGSSFLGPELIAMEMVERIEVVRGPVSALHGANAFFGAVNVITRSQVHDGAVADGHCGLDAELGYTCSAGLRVAAGPWRYAAGAGHWRTSYDGRRLPGSSPDFAELDAAGNLESEDTRVRADHAFARAGYHGERFEADAMVRLARRAASAEFADFARLTHETVIATSTFDGRLLGRARVTPALTLTASLSGAVGGPTDDEWLATGAGDSVPRREFGYRAGDALFEARLAFRAQDSLTLGVDGSVDDEDLIEIYSVDRETGVATRTGEAAGRQTFTNGGAYAQAMIHPWADLGLTGNLRVDEHSQYGGALTYRLGAVYTPTRHMATKLLYGTSFKAPPVLQLYSQPLFPGEVIGNDDLEPERAATLEASFAWQPRGDLAFSVVGYYSRVRDKVELVPVATNLQPTNIARQEGHGGELEAWWRPGRHQVKATLAYQDTDTITDSVFVGETSSPSERYPGLVEQLRWSWASETWGRPGVALRYVSSRRASLVNIRENLQTPYALEPYLTVDLVYSRRVWREVSLGLRLDNLTDADDAEPGFGGVDLPRSGRRGWIFLVLDVDLHRLQGRPR